MSDSRERSPAIRTTTPHATRSAPTITDAAVPNVLTPPASAERAATVGRAKAPGMTLDEPKVTPGIAGATDIVIEKFWVEVEGNLPAGFRVHTKPTHELDVTLEQQSYRKSFSGTGALETGLTPVAPIGVTGRIVARDLTTGEVVEQPWTWKSRGGAGGGLWTIIKRLLWKG